MVVVSARTRDGEWHVHLHEDQTAELWQGRFRIIGRTTMWHIGKRLAEEGIEVDDLIRD